MKVKNLFNGIIKEVEIPDNLDYGPVIKDDVIIGLVSPSTNCISKEYLDRICLNKTKYSNLLATIEREKKVSDDI